VREELDLALARRAGEDPRVTALEGGFEEGDRERPALYANSAIVEVHERTALIAALAISSAASVGLSTNT
jgi:hypothetical protein